MSAGSPKPEEDSTMVDGASEADAARPVKFEHRKGVGPGEGGSPAGDEAPDAGELAGSKRKDGEPAPAASPASPGAIPPDEVTTETDDGVS
ncbi:hypothetical protein [Hansschlegelia sp. KR7-227]|uniref:hypothetical protein n=1 Tax=Hansschlegelia sp. KR7-227 TaxID=3400914 RepID=UPI003C128E93